MPLSPGVGALRLLVAWSVLALAALAWPAAVPLWQAAGVGLAVALVWATAIVWPAPRLKVTRHVPPALPLGEWTEVRLRFVSEDRHRLRLEVFDHAPAHAEIDGQPARLELDAEGGVDLAYRLRPRRRGEAGFGPIEVWRHAPGDLVRRRLWLGAAETVRVLPNFRPILTQGLAGLHETMARLGIHLQRQRGEGLEFQELRDYRAGDSLRQVDWKATARRSRLISRQYQEERNQQVVLLLDCGRRMHAQEGDLTHFDHVLNAALLLAYVAVRQGDAVGFQSFAGEERWLPPERGRAAVNRVLDALHDLQTSTESPDFAAAAGRLMQRQRRRALVLLVTNLRDEDTDELLPALVSLRRRHLVLVASTRELALGRLRDQPMVDLDAALEVAAAHGYLEARRLAHERVRSTGAFVLDEEPQDLPLALVSRYLEIKRAGQL
ncbi:MAG: DUF58 domain-containing protein [Acidobacteriota bacterium]